MTSVDVLAPCPGRLVPLSETPDPVFASEMVGPGVAIDPDPGEVTVVSPIAGKVVKVHPHAFVVLGAGGVGALVHLGIDTVQLEGEGFELLVAEGAEVTTGTPIVRWDPAAIEAGGRSPIVPIVVMDSAPDSVHAAATGTVRVGDEIFTV